MSDIILVVDDEPTIVEILTLYLEREGYQVLSAADGDRALALATEHAPALLILDIMLPKRSGLEILTRLRPSSTVPIILLTARGEEMDRIAGLDMGADDYIVKPFSPREVVARVKTVLRRSGSRREASDERLVQAGDITINPRERGVQVAGRDVQLTAKEFDLLHFLARHPRQVFTRDQLLDHVWGTEYIADESTVTVHVRRLREKVEDDPGSPRRVVTVWGVGYRFNG